MVNMTKIHVKIKNCSIARGEKSNNRVYTYTGVPGSITITRVRFKFKLRISVIFRLKFSFSLEMTIFSKMPQFKKP